MEKNNSVLVALCRATEWDRQIDLDIALSIGWTKMPENIYRAGLKDPEGAFHWTPPLYTGSIDAAMRLVPEGYYVSVERFSDGWYAEVAPKSNLPGFDGRQKPAAIALCIAAIKARAAAENEKVTAP
jgi:hypothetical protein